MKNITEACEIAMARDLDGAIPPEREKACLEHLAACEACRTTQGLLERLASTDLAGGLDGPLDALNARRAVDAVLERYEAALGAPSRAFLRPRKRIWLPAAAAAVLLAIGATAFVVSGGFGSGAPSIRRSTKVKAPAATALLSGSRFVLLVGAVTMGDSNAGADSPLELGAPLRTQSGRAIAELPYGVAFAAESGTELYVSAPEQGAIAVRLTGGEALFAADPGVERSGFSVVTDAGRIEVKGTAFSVSVGQGGVRVSMLDGEVRIVEADGTARSLGAGFTATLGNPAIVQNSAEIAALLATRARDLKGLRLALHIPEERLAMPVAGDSAAAAGPAEKSRVPLGSPRAAQPSIAELMAAAREQKSKADWAAAARTYEELIAVYANSDEAFVARLSLGGLHLRNLGNPARALECYDGYLAARAGGSLAYEALWGEAEALRALGRKDDERRALEALVAEYPSGLNTAAAKNRLAELSR